MATVILDFDSTIITSESLEEVLQGKLNPVEMEKIKAITNQGMSGSLPFLDSLKMRLSVAPLSKEDFVACSEKLKTKLTEGFEALIKKLMREGIEVWILSGALREMMLPVGKFLGIPPERILGIELEWTPEGLYHSIDGNRPLHRSKWEGAQDVAQKWSSPKIAVGDGITDYALFEHGLVDYFIAYTGNVRREALLNKGAYEAQTVKELDKILRGILHGRAFLPKR